ncbi:MAG: hypothetical protein H7199_04150 [Burkholderiales bacterium]|nr:hypothetical protein [Flavobacterium sp.]
MRFLNSNRNVVYLLTGIYFLMLFTEVIAEVLIHLPLIIFTRIATPLLLILIYTVNSERKNPLFFFILIILLLSNILFFYKTAPLFYLGIIAFIIQRIIMVVFIFKLLLTKNYQIFVLSTIPFLIIFLYLILITGEISMIEFSILVIQSLLISLLGGLAVSSYIQIDNRANSWLLISTLLFIGLRFVLFIEKYYLSIISLSVISPMAVILNFFAFFAFYKFVIAAEQNEKTDLYFPT